MPVQRMSEIRRRYPAGAEAQPDGSTHFRVWAPEPRQIALRIEDGDNDARRRAGPGGRRLLFAAGRRCRGRDALSLRARWRCPCRSRVAISAGRPVRPFRGRRSRALSLGTSLARESSSAGQVIYELHVGTFTPEGTWRAAIEKLPLLADSGITTIELMPVAEFPGRFGWGYDGVDSVRADASVRHARRLPRLRRSRARDSGSASSSTSSTTTSARTAVSSGASPRLLHRALRERVGRGAELRRRRCAAGARVLRGERGLLDRRVPSRRPAARRHAERSTTLAASTSLRRSAAARARPRAAGRSS